MRHTKARILHVDDHQDTRLLMASVLGHAHYGVMTAGGVTEAVQLAKELPFDLFILDIRLNDGTGVELCQKLRELQSNVPVLYYSAYADEKDQEKALATCGDAYLKKPVSISELEEAVEGLLAKYNKLPAREPE
jgi:DNA-binding response OmpR family regulator